MNTNKLTQNNLYQKNHFIVELKTGDFLIKKQYILLKRKKRVFLKQNKNMLDMTVRHKKTLYWTLLFLHQT